MAGNSPQHRMSEPILRVVEPGLSTTVQDRGRFGSQRFGVSGAGAIDFMSLALANHLVGNHADVAALEMTMFGDTFEVLSEGLAIGLVGADMQLRCNSELLAPNQTHFLRLGDKLEIGGARTGLRAYLAVAGGIAVPLILGSSSTHLRAGMGGFDGRALTKGDVIHGIPQSMQCRRRLKPDRKPYFGGVVRILAGPQADAFRADALTIIVNGRFLLSTHSDRMAVRLEGPALSFVDGFNIVSDGIVAGSIQVPGHGRPLVLLSDRQTTGGYPKIATVITPDLARIGQRRPNERVRFHFISADEAEHIYIRWTKELDQIDRYFEQIKS